MTSQCQSYERDQIYRHTLNHKNRHLIYLIDGTCNDSSLADIDNPNTNIFKLVQHISSENENGEQQIVSYFPGVATELTTSNDDDKINEAILPSIRKEVRRVYMNIAVNYQEMNCGNMSDKIYIFGFSRGAFIAYLLARLISTYGLLHVGSLNLWDQLWEDFIKFEPTKASNQGSCSRENEYINYSKRNVEIDFLGLFDLVPGLTMPGLFGVKNIFNNHSCFIKNIINSCFGKSNHNNAINDANFLIKNLLSSHESNQVYWLEMPECVRTAVHLLALDETRALYKPGALFIQNSKINDEKDNLLNGNNKKTQNYSFDESEQQLLQILVPGVHSDIGGGYKDSFFSDLSLLTLLNLCRSSTFIKLKFNESCKLASQIQYNWDIHNIHINDELKYFGFFVGKFGNFFKKIGEKSFMPWRPLRDRKFNFFVKYDKNSVKKVRLGSEIRSVAHYIDSICDKYNETISSSPDQVFSYAISKPASEINDFTLNSDAESCNSINDILRNLEVASQILNNLSKPLEDETRHFCLHPIIYSLISEKKRIYKRSVEAGLLTYKYEDLNTHLDTELNNPSNFSINYNMNFISMLHNDKCINDLFT